MVVHVNANNPQYKVRIFILATMKWEMDSRVAQYLGQMSGKFLMVTFTSCLSTGCPTVVYVSNPSDDRLKQMTTNCSDGRSRASTLGVQRLK